LPLSWRTRQRMLCGHHQQRSLDISPRAVPFDR
jgi:hypothetical protein